MCAPECDDERELRGGSPSIDATLEILSSPVRRDVIGHCSGASTQPIDIDDVADHVVEARQEAGAVLDREEVLIALHHRHLPVLEEHDVIEFDRRSGQLRYWSVDRIEEWLERIRAEETE